MIPAPRREPPVTPQTLAIIRTSLLVGVLLFGAAILVVHRQSSWARPEPERLRTVRRCVLVLWGVASLVLLVLRTRLERVRSEQARWTLLIVAWAVAEAAALAGGVDAFVGGHAAMYGGGLFVMIVAFVLFPVR